MGTLSPQSTPEEVRAAWYARLRAGDLRQGTYYLHTETDDSYCCLGVLCALGVEAGVAQVVTSEEVSGHARTRYGDPQTNDTEIQLLPQAVQTWAGLTEVNPEVTRGLDDEERYQEADGTVHDTEESDVASLNDSGDYTFAEIADLLEHQYDRRHTTV